MALDFYIDPTPKLGPWFISIPRPSPLLDKHQEEGMFILGCPLPRVFNMIIDQMRLLCLLSRDSQESKALVMCYWHCELPCNDVMAWGSTAKPQTSKRIDTISCRGSNLKIIGRDPGSFYI